MKSAKKCLFYSLVHTTHIKLVFCHLSLILITVLILLGIELKRLSKYLFGSIVTIEKLTNFGWGQPDAFKHTLITKHDVGPLFCCPIFVIKVEFKPFLLHGLCEERLLSSRPWQQLQYVLQQLLDPPVKHVYKLVGQFNLDPGSCNVWVGKHRPL